MARMIPSYFPTSPPSGEQAMSRALAPATGTGWVVMHSLAIAGHIHRVEGEAGFVVIAPGNGPLVIKVKFHHRISRDADGPWHLSNQRAAIQAVSGEQTRLSTARTRALGSDPDAGTTQAADRLIAVAELNRCIIDREVRHEWC